MGTYGSQKAEYITAFGGIFKLYSRLFLPVFILYSIVNLTWRCTVSGYDNPLLFMFDAILLMLAAASMVSLFNMDKYALFINIIFLMALGADKLYRTSELLPLLAAAQDAGTADAGMMGMGGMGGMGMSGMGMGGMGMDMGMETPAPVMPDVPVSIIVSTLFSLIGAISAEIASSPGFLRFLVISECEIYLGILLVFIISFAANGGFYFKTLPQLRDNT